MYGYIQVFLCNGCNKSAITETREVLNGLTIRMQIYYMAYRNKNPFTS